MEEEAIEKLKPKIVIPKYLRALVIVLISAVLDILDYVMLFTYSPAGEETSVLFYSVWSDIYLILLGPMLDFVIIMIVLFWYGWDEHKVAILLMMSELVMIIGWLAPMLLIGAVKLFIDVRGKRRIAVGE